MKGDEASAFVLGCAERRGAFGDILSFLFSFFIIARRLTVRKQKLQQAFRLGLWRGI
jgi:hypothetical protein